MQLLLEPWIALRREQRSSGAKHPVDDFLFDYYPYSIAKLAAWHPGAGIVLLGDADISTRSAGCGSSMT